MRGWLKSGGVIAYPTESCYGLGCDPMNPHAVQRILQLKGRPQSKGLILIAARVEQLKRYVDAEALQAAGDSGYWPGPVTLLLPATRHCPPWLTGRHDKLAVRVTAHPAAALLCEHLGTALVSTSANRAGGRSLKNARDCYRMFGGQTRVIPGKTGTARRPSTIIDFATGDILRS
ncbi:threonylcarbamoyl-AMP synthase [Sulfuriferula plumbiphila]|uniref:Threonylcarbamoyl-AMP synthase n=1 Tax=Sulfuriferula plumbiphila TaxID=171865 RepID=A0A512LA42_9PROT|nr:threonylcarbamoyl-AMP synthase [Sulfuriferula plumbiphila]GEP31347.1 threonylcarbamoyl-AMP synthase [Sulfuriferula plumbiphila]